MNKKIQKRESFAGFHYYNVFQCCPWKGFLKYALRITPKYTAVPLIGGAAFHEGKAIFYKTKSRKKAISKVIRDIEEREKEVETVELYDTLLQRTPILLAEWIDRQGYEDLEEFTFLGIEDEIIMKFQVNDLTIVHTIRPDAIVREKSTNNIYILETKTSSFSIRVTQEGVECGDQATAYLLGVKEKYKVEPYGVIPDIAYWNARAKDESNIAIVRGEPVMRSDLALEQYKRGFIQTNIEISQKMKAFFNGTDPSILFPRNTYYCTAFMKKCEYHHICRSSKLTMKGPAPRGFRRQNRRNLHLHSYVADSIMGLT